MNSIVGQENLPVKNNLLFDDCSLFKSTIFEEKFREQWKNEKGSFHLFAASIALVLTNIDLQ